MLLNLTVENWMSFRDEATLNMTSSLERQHMDTLSKVPGFRSKKAVPITAVYGGNASGKTGLFQALDCLKEMVLADPGVNGVVPVEPYLLEDGSALKPTLLDVTFMIRDSVYRLIVEATVDRITYECLEKISEKGSMDIYERDASRDVPFVINEDFFEEPDHVRYAAKSTRENRLFLGSAVSQNVKELDMAYSWFDSVLELVGVESQAWSFARSFAQQEGFLEYAANILSRLDTGIVNLTTEVIALDGLPKVKNLREQIAKLDEQTLLTLVGENVAGDYGFEMITVRLEDGEPVAKRLRTVHKGSDGREHSFALARESSGTQRLMGLLPMLFDLVNDGDSSMEKVYVVDELDRCLHTMLTKRLIEDFLKTCGPSARKQLLFTTHDLLLMDQSLMRRDEMYITQRGIGGSSELVALSDFRDIRYDKDLIRSYLDGRFGGVPMFGEVGVCG